MSLFASVPSLPPASKGRIYQRKRRMTRVSRDPLGLARVLPVVVEHGRLRRGRAEVFDACRCLSVDVESGRSRTAGIAAAPPLC